MKGWSRICFIAVVVFLINTLAYSENVRGRLAAAQEVTASSSVKFPLDALVSIQLDQPKDFLQAVEIEITIPPEMRRYPDSFAISLFKNVTPRPNKSDTSYFADRIISVLIPASTKFYMRVPVHKDHTLKALQGTTIIQEHVDSSEFPLVLSILPVMKGIPTYVYESRFDMKLKPIYFSKGKAKIALQEKNTKNEVDPETVSLKIDQKEVPYPQDEYILPVGIHTLHIISSQYKDLSLQFGVEESKTNVLHIDLELEQAYLRFEAPEQAVIFINGEQYEGALRKNNEIAAGSHTVLFKLGEYSISKKFEIKPGKNYTISLFFDIFINED